MNNTFDSMCPVMYHKLHEIVQSVKQGRILDSTKQIDTIIKLMLYNHDIHDFRISE